MYDYDRIHELISVLSSIRIGNGYLEVNVVGTKERLDVISKGSEEIIENLAGL